MRFRGEMSTSEIDGLLKLSLHRVAGIQPTTIQDFQSQTLDSPGSSSLNRHIDTNVDG